MNHHNLKSATAYCVLFRQYHFLKNSAKFNVIIIFIIIIMMANESFLISTKLHPLGSPHSSFTVVCIILSGNVMIVGGSQVSGTWKLYKTPQ